MKIEYLSCDLAELGDGHFEAVRAYWDERRAGRAMPAWSDIELVTLPPAVLPFISVIDVLSEPADFIYRFWGTGHTDVKGYDLTGHSVLEHRPEEQARQLFDEFKAVAESAVPQAFIHRVRARPGNPFRTQQALRLPLSDDGVTVNHILSYSNWGAHRSAWKEMYTKPRWDR